MLHSQHYRTHFGTNFAYNVNFPGILGNLHEFFLARMVVVGVLICEIGVNFPLTVTLPGGKTLKSHQTDFESNFAPNVNLPGKLRKFTGFLIMLEW